MKHLDEFRQMLASFDKQVFEKAVSVICQTKSSLDGLTGPGNPIIYVRNGIQLAAAHRPILIEGGLMPSSNLFLIQTQVFDEAVKKCAMRHPEGVTGPLLFEMAVRRVLLKYLAIQEAAYGGVKNYVKSGDMLSPEQQLMLMESSGLSAEGLEEYFEKECRLNTEAFTKIPGGYDPQFLACTARAESVIGMMFMCVWRAQIDHCTREAIVVLRDLVQSASTPPLSFG